MPNATVNLSYECVEELHSWVHANCPCALENRDFLPGLFAIVEREIEARLHNQRAKSLKNFQSPGLQ